MSYDNQSSEYKESWSTCMSSMEAMVYGHHECQKLYFQFQSSELALKN